MKYSDFELDKLKGYAKENEPSAVEALMDYYLSREHFDERLFLQYAEQGAGLRIPRCSLAHVTYAMKEWGLDTRLHPEQLDLLESAADNELPEAADLYVRYILYNEINRDTPKVIRLAKLLFEDQRYHSTGLHALAHLTLKPCFGLDDEEVGFHYLIRSGIENNHDDAVMVLCMNFQNGIKWKLDNIQKRKLMNTLRADDAEQLAVWSMLSALKGESADLSAEVENLKRRAAQGYKDCILLLARLYINGVGVDRDYSEAYRLLTQAGLTTNPRSLFTMVALYLQKESPVYNPEEGWMNLMWGYEDDMPRFAAVAAGKRILLGKDSCPYDLDLHELIEKGLELNDLLAEVIHMACLTHGWEGYEKNRELALSLYNPLSEDQHDLLGIWLYALNHGKGWQGLWEEAERWEDQSAELRKFMRKGGELYLEMEQGFILHEEQWTKRFLEEALFRYWL